MAAILLLKVTLVLLGTLAAAHLLGRAPAVARHRLWSGVFIALLMLPVLIVTVPAVSVPVPDEWLAAVSSTPATQAPHPANASARQTARDRRASWDSTNAIVTEPADFHPDPLPPALPTGRTLLALAWLLGAGAAATALVLSLRAVRRLDRDAEVVLEPEWQSAAESISASLGLRRRARLLWSGAIQSPMAGGFIRPAIFLPDSARHWSSEQRVIVLTHEIAHLVARDPLRHVLARLALACYWFHPLAWLAARQASIAREQACDEVVLSRGIRPSAYARMLLDLAESLDAGAPTVGALPMVQRSLLEKRVMSILNSDVRPVRRLMVMIPLVCLAAFTLVVAAAQPNKSEAKAPAPPAAIAVAPDAPSSAVAQSSDRDSTCTWDGSRWRGTDRVIQKSFGDLRTCMVAEGLPDRMTDTRPSAWLDDATRIVIETERRGVVHRFEIDRQPGGSERTSWRVSGVERAFDAAARQWRTQTLAVLDTTWELSTLRGHVSSLRGEISSILGERSSLQGEISSLQGEVSSMRGEISSVRGEESSLRGEISSIRGHLSSLRGAISSEQGSISSLNASRYDLNAADRRAVSARIAEHEAEIQRLERAIRDYDADGRVAAVEKEIAALNADGKVADIEARIRKFDLNERVAEVERKIKALDVDNRIGATAKQIDALDAERRGRQLEQRRETELKQLEAAIAALK